MRRRDFIALAAVLPAWQRAAAQQPSRIRRVAVLMPYSPSDAEVQTRVRAFREGLHSHGWSTGDNVQFDERWTTDNMDLIRVAAANLLELKPDAIVTIGRTLATLMSMTSTVPIIIAGGADPASRGGIESLARPGGNVTGFSSIEASVFGKMLQTLKEIAPSISRVAVIAHFDNPAGESSVRSLESFAKPLGIDQLNFRFRDIADMEQAIATLAAHPNGGVLFPPDVSLSKLIDQTVALLQRYRVPAIYSDRSLVRRGGLVYYGADRVDIFRRAASYVDRVLRGERVGNLPYQLPTKYELVINSRAAKSLGLEIPSRLLFTADEVIE